MGALTSKPYAFTARSWELKAVESIDLTDCEGANIRLQLRGNTVLRVLPFINPAVNGEWISDRARFSYDALTKQRLTQPLFDTTILNLLDLKNRIKFFSLNKNSLTYSASRSGWELVFRWIKKAFVPGRDKLFGLLSPSLSSEASYLFKNTFSKLGCSHLINYDLDEASPQFAAEPWFLSPANINIANSDLIFCLGVNLRFEAPTLFANIRKELQRSPTKRILFLAAETGGFAVDQYLNLGSGLQSTLTDLFLAKHTVSKRFTKALNPLMIVGRSGLRALKLNPALFSVFVNFLSTKIPLAKTNILSQFVIILRSGANSYFQAALNSFEPVFNSRSLLESNLVTDGRNFLLGVGQDNFEFVDRSRFAAVLYASSHKPLDVLGPDLVLPMLSFAEEAVDCYNFKGQKQTTRLAVNSVSSESRSYTQLARALAQIFNISDFNPLIGYENLSLLEPLAFGSISSNHFILPTIDVRGLTFLKEERFYPPLTNQQYYQADSYLRSSSTMALRAKLQKTKFSNFAVSSQFALR